ncbi:MAG TPA: hypothetical protein PLC15_21025 [Candidatus Obscuribacter sp.]|nr:hypothetical protein [Candidatus Obscuribacter sp.]HMX44724.1 hypothetical protein [Candidatus Obscuribacter sp.]HMY02047.1 hypothetical protein [Candidatus Obscuribacter sp.]HMY53328.1 hypothetical protein [Candidatus Obscuribacter sp.]HNB17883.1 hypothetical protein [Candidatus Obscuribacter sp.]
MFDLKPLMESLQRVEALLQSIPGSLIIVNGETGLILGIDDRKAGFVSQSNVKPAGEPLNLANIIKTERTPQELLTYMRGRPALEPEFVEVIRKDGSTVTGIMVWSEMTTPRPEQEKPLLVMLIPGSTENFPRLS